jgi:hypothetical protein
LLNRGGNERDEAFVLGLLSTRILDWYSRKTIELNFNFHIFNNLPVPEFHSANELEEFINISARLAAPDNRFQEWADSLGIKVGTVIADSEKFELTTRLEALTAKGFGLNEKEIGHIFSTFHTGWDYKETLAKVIEHFRSGIKHA